VSDALFYVREMEDSPDKQVAPPPDVLGEATTALGHKDRKPGEMHEYASSVQLRACRFVSNHHIVYFEESMNRSHFNHFMIQMMKATLAGKGMFSLCFLIYFVWLTFSFLSAFFYLLLLLLFIIIFLFLFFIFYFLFFMVLFSFAPSLVSLILFRTSYLIIAWFSLIR
jgi:hypothetical protein